MCAVCGSVQSRKYGNADPKDLAADKAKLEKQLARKTNN